MTLQKERMNAHQRRSCPVERVDQMDHFELNPWYQVQDRQEQHVEHIYHLHEINIIS